MGEGIRPCLFSVMGNRHGRVTEQKGDQFSGRNLGMTPKGNINSTLHLQHSINLVQR